MVSDIPQAEAGGFLASGSLRLDWTIGEMMSQKRKKEKGRKQENGKRRIMFIMMKTRRLRGSRVRGEMLGWGEEVLTLPWVGFSHSLATRGEGSVERGGGKLSVLS